MLVEKLYSLYNDMPGETFNGRWHVTWCLGCERAMAHVARGCLEIQIPPSNRQLMDDGLLHEADIIARLEIAGVDIQDRNIVLMPADALLIGRPDGAIVVSPELLRLGIPTIRIPKEIGLNINERVTLEIKTVDGAMFDLLSTKHIVDIEPRYGKQVQVYMRYQGTQKTLFLIKDRSKGRYTEQLYGYDDSIAQDIINKVNRVTSLISHNRPCEDIPPSMDFLTKLFCSYKTLCQDCSYADKRITDAYFVGIATDWLDRNILQGDLNGEMEAIKNILGEALGAMGVKSYDIATGNGIALRVMAVSQNRQVANMDLAKKVLTSDMYNEIFEQKASNFVRLQKVDDHGPATG